MVFDMNSFAQRMQSERKHQTECLDRNSFSELAMRSNVVFFYSGNFSQSVVEAGVEAIKSRFAAGLGDSRTRRRLLSSFVEIAQNVVNYSAIGMLGEGRPAMTAGFATMHIAAYVDRVTVTCANPVPLSAQAGLAEKLNAVRGMSGEELRRAFRERLGAAEAPQGSKGAGLGLLTLARDAREPIQFEFIEDPAWGPEVRLFHLKVTL